MQPKKYNRRKTQSPTLAAIIQSPIFQHINKRAAGYAANPVTILQVLQRAVSRTSALGVKGLEGDLRENLGRLTRMLKAVVRREYRDVPYASLLKAMVGMLYFLFIADLIPDILPVVGYLDDVTVLSWVMSSIRQDLEDFQAWEDQGRHIEA